MDKKTQKSGAGKKTGPQFSSAVKDSAQQIWLAGLGAFSKAQEEGSKVFEALVKEGVSIQRKTHTTAEEKIAEAASRLTGLASDIQAKAGHPWDRLENIFEDRVAKALRKLGVPSMEDLTALTARIDQLDKRLQRMNRSGTAGSATLKTAAKRAAKKPPASGIRHVAKKAAGQASD